MSVDPSDRSRSQQDSPVRLSRQLIAALERTPGFQRRSSPPAAPWATLWLLGTTAGIATPLAIQTFSASRPPAPPPAGPATVASRTDGNRMGLRLDPSFRSPTPAAPQAGQPKPSAADGALLAAFSSLPSPFPGEHSTNRVPGAEVGTADDNPGPAWQAPAPSFVGTDADRLGGALSLADRLETPLGPFERAVQPDPRLQADHADPQASRWSAHLRALVQQTPLVLPVEVVRVRSRSVDRTQAIPMALWPDGSATTNVAPPAPADQRLAEEWVRQQPALMEGSVRPVVMVIEPEAPAPVVPTTTHPHRAAVTPPAPAPAWEAPAAAPPAPAAAEPPAAQVSSPMAATPEAEPAPAP